MKLAQMRKLDIANGPGIRVTIFVSGCNFHCPECFNSEYQDFNYGQNWNLDTENEIIEASKNPVITGLSILGGEPLHQDDEGIEILSNFIKRFKRETGKTVWLWTGYEFERIPEKYQKVLENIDVIVDGPFKKELKNPKLKFRGSSNQRIIDVKKTLKSSNVILMEEFYE